MSIDHYKKKHNNRIFLIDWQNMEITRYMIDVAHLIFFSLVFMNYNMQIALEAFVGLLSHTHTTRTTRYIS